MAIVVSEQVYLPDHLNPCGYPVVKPLTLTRHKGDSWPLKADAPFLTNFSVFYEMDSGEVYVYDAAYDCWRHTDGNIVSNTT